MASGCRERSVSAPIAHGRLFRRAVWVFLMRKVPKGPVQVRVVPSMLTRVGQLSDSEATKLKLEARKQQCNLSGGFLALKLKS